MRGAPAGPPRAGARLPSRLLRPRRGGGGPPAGFRALSRAPDPGRAEHPAGGCDERIGRICIWFGGEGETDFPPEPTETRNARIDLIRDLSEIHAQIRDPWVTGQLVHYLVESGALDEAESVARACDLAEPWWCAALLGYVLHMTDRHVEAEAAFREAALQVPGSEEERWLTPRFILSNDGVDAFEDVDPEERSRLWELFWRFSDPLYLVEGTTA